MKLLLPYAYDANRNLVHIDNAQKGQKYTCPNCGAELLLKISRIPKGQKYHKRNHFAHKGDSDNHCSESFLHKLFKERCADLIRSKISTQEELPFGWECGLCSEHHKGNLVKKAVTVVTEYDLGVCKPDIALLDSNGKVIIVMEVVVTHKPDDSAIQYYKDNKIACLLINVEDFSDCDKDKLQEKILHPSECITQCPNPICQRCKRRMNTATMIIMKTLCWHCRKEIKVTYLTTNVFSESIKPSSTYLDPHEFTREELDKAVELGAIIFRKYNKRHKYDYYVNYCEHCYTKVGHIYDYLVRDSNATQRTIESEVNVGHKCWYCIQEEKEKN